MKQRYIQRKYLTPDDTEDIWQLLYPEHFVSTLLVHHLKRRSEKGISQVAGMMMKGLLEFDKFVVRPQDSELLYKKFKTHKISEIFNPIQIEDGKIIDPKMMLIDGAPGMGKTTLCKQIVQGWAEGSLLTDCSLVFLLFLRNPAVHKIHSLKDLVHYCYGFEKTATELSEQCANMLLMQGDINITIILDGYDEFSNDDGSLLVTKIIKREILLHCKLVITSRPMASEKLQKISDVRVEVLGFTKESQNCFIEKELKCHPDKIEKLLSFLDSHANIRSTCYIPIMLTILVCMFKEYDKLPNEDSELYEQFVSLTISRFLQKLEGNPPVTVLSLQHFPESYREYLSKFCEFAYQAISTRNIVFTKDDVKTVCPNFAMSINDFHGLGLLNCTKFTDYSKGIIDYRISYNFIHLSIQEYLAAYHINTLTACDQFQLLKGTFFADYIT